MSTKVLIKDLYPVIDEVLASGGQFTFIPGGVSMRPTLNGTDDEVTVAAANIIGKYDIVLFRRADGQYVLHRVVGVRGDTFTVVGDNQIDAEYIGRGDILAIVVGYRTRRGEVCNTHAGARRAAVRRFLRKVKRKMINVKNSMAE